MSFEFNKLQDVADIVDSLHKTPTYSKVGKPVVRCTDVKYGRLDVSRAFLVDESTFTEFNRRYKAKINDIIITRVGSYGNTAFVTNTEICLGQNVAAIIPKINARYLYLALNSRVVKNQIDSAVVGSTQKTLSLKAISNLDIPRFGDKAEAVIAKTLGEIDDKIELNRQTNQTLEQIAQALFKSWFVDFEPTRAKIAAKEAGASTEEIERAAMCAISGKTPDQLAQLPPETQQNLKTTAALFPDALVDSELGAMPEGWGVKSLSSIANYLNGLALQKFRPENGEESIPVLKIAQLKKGVADGEERASANIKPEYIVKNGDVIFSWSGSLEVDLWCGGRVALNQHLFKVTSETVPKWFYYFWTKQHLESFQQIAADKAVTMGHIKRSHLDEAKCLIPNFDLFDFSAIENIICKQIELRIENFSLMSVRDELLPKLLSGEIEPN